VLADSSRARNDRAPARRLISFGRSRPGQPWAPTCLCARVGLLGSAGTLQGEPHETALGAVGAEPCRIQRCPRSDPTLASSDKSRYASEVLSLRRLAAVGAILAGAALVAVALTSAETDEEAISRQLKTLAEAVSILEGEGLLYRRARLNAVFTDVLSDDARVDAPELGRVEQGRSAVTMLATRAGTLYQAGRVELGDLDIRLSDSRKSARVEGLASVIASRRSSGREQRHVVFELGKLDGDWRVRSVRVAQAADSGE
jgi:hypothetical protein